MTALNNGAYGRLVLEHELGRRDVVRSFLWEVTPNSGCLICKHVSRFI